MADRDIGEILSGRDSSGAQPRDEHGRFSTATPAEPEAPESPEPLGDTAQSPAPVAAPAEVAPAPEPVAAPVPQNPTQVPTSALLEERKKRQEYERRLQELEQQLAQTRQPPQAQKPPEPPADFWTDPQAFIAAQVQQAREAALSEADMRMRHQFANVCEQNARYRYQDYDAVRDTFLQRVESDPVLRAELAQASDPAEFAYRTGKRLQEVEQVGSLEQWREQERAKIRAELEAQLRPVAPKPPVPQSLNAEPSPATSADAWSGPRPLSAILKR